MIILLLVLERASGAVRRRMPCLLHLQPTLILCQSILSTPGFGTATTSVAITGHNLFKKKYIIYFILSSSKETYGALFSLWEGRRRQWFISFFGLWLVSGSGALREGLARNGQSRRKTHMNARKSLFLIFFKLNPF
jgi:hypothetical protein